MLIAGVPNAKANVRKRMLVRDDPVRVLPLTTDCPAVAKQAW